MILDNLKQIKIRIQASIDKYQRSDNSVELLAVSKTKSVDEITQAILAGQYSFGENYVQEGINKITHFHNTPYHAALTWHFIGPLQSNKSKHIAMHFDWIHTVDSIKLVQRLANQRPDSMAPLNVLIQVNLSEEETKSGVSFDEVNAIVDEIMRYDKLQFRGLMAIPAPLGQNPTLEQQDNHYQTMLRLSDKLVQLKQDYPTMPIDTLSMGMSDDLDIAIKAGSTLVRVGTAIFGTRNYP